MLCPGMGPAQAATDRVAERIDACALLLPSEISRVVGVSVDAGARHDQGFQPDGTYSSTCLWVVKLEQPQPVGSRTPFDGKSGVILNVIRWPLGSGKAHEFLDSFYTAYLHGEIPAQPRARKIGDDALWWGDGLAVRSRDIGFGLSIAVSGSDPGRPGIREEQLAQYVLDRIARQVEAAPRTTDP
jgi:hypothetical protein